MSNIFLFIIANMASWSFFLNKTIQQKFTRIIKQTQNKAQNTKLGKIKLFSRKPMKKKSYKAYVAKALSVTKLQNFLFAKHVGYLYIY